jgi:hypothetical protein
VGGRSDREPVLGRVETQAGQLGHDRGEALGEVLQAGRVQPEVLDVLLEHAGGDGPADLVPRQQLVDEALALGVAQQGAVTPQRLREQGPRHGGVVEGGGVELLELDVGHGHPRPQRHGDPVARSLRRVGGDGEQLAVAARGHEHVAGSHLDALAPLGRRHHPPAATAVHDQIEGEGALVDGSTGLLDGLHQRAFDLGAGGGTPGVDDPGQGVAALTRQLELPVGVAVERRTEGDELMDPGRPLVDQHPDGVDVAEAGPRREGVGQVQIGRVGVAAAQHRGDASLGPPGGRLLQLGLREDPDGHPVELSGPHRRRQTGHP